MWGDTHDPNRGEGESGTVPGFDDANPDDVNHALLDALDPGPSASESTPEVAPEREPAPVYDLIRYDVTDKQLAELRTKFAGLAERKPENYEPRRKAIATCRELRVAVEKKRKELSADAVQWHKKVNAVAKHFREALEAIEEPLQLAKDADDNEKARIRAEREAAEKAALEAKVRAEQEAAEAERRAKVEAEEAERKAKREAEEQRLAEERAELERQREALAAQQRQADEVARAERERREAEEAARRAELDAEADRLKAEREAAAEAARLEREQIEADRRAVAAERERLEREAREKKLAEEAAQRAREQAEAERVVAEEARVREEERKAELARRLEALKPDAEKVAAFARTITLWLGSLYPPECSSPIATNAIDHAIRQIGRVADELVTGFERESRFAAEDAAGQPQEAP